MAYDSDGTTGFYYDNSTLFTMSQAQLNAFNDENGGFIGWTSITAFQFGLIFPELRDIVAYSPFITNSHNWTFQVSADSTNGLDGTWTTIHTNAEGDGTFSVSTKTPYYRQSSFQLTTSQLGIQGVKFSGTDSRNAYALMLYGYVSSSQTRYLRAWHPTLNQQADGTTADFNDIARSTNATKQFRVKNLHGTLTAHSITVSENTLTDASPSIVTGSPAQLQFSTDNVTFANSVNIGDLAAGAISNIIYWKDSVVSNAQLSVWAFRAKASASTWS
jgi:hypothetical protein